MLLIFASFVGLLFLGIDQVAATQAEVAFSSASDTRGQQSRLLPAANAQTLAQLPWASAPLPTASARQPATDAVAVSRAITGLVLPRTGLTAEVTEAAFDAGGNGAPTWSVPAFRVGHAEHSAGAGEIGNAVLLGHVSSRNSGNVFQDLDQVEVGDPIELYTSTTRFDYQVVDIRAVSRDDTRALQPTQTASVSLITCTGVWLPVIWDYTQRLVVRAELTQPAAGQPW